MSYSKIDLNKMDQAGQVIYLTDLVRDMRDLLSGDDSLDDKEILQHATQAINDLTK
jgi:hypothetical protein